MQKTPVGSLSWEDPLEKEMATHSSTLGWDIPWAEEPGGLQSMGAAKGSDTGKQLNNCRGKRAYRLCYFTEREVKAQGSYAPNHLASR